MKALLYKELKLALHPTTYLFMAIGAMLMIPSYPYYVAFVYTCLSIFFIFLSARENKDIFYTASLPVRKSDVVKSRVLTVAIIELLQLAIGIPFAIIGAHINPNATGNQAGIEANLAFFGLVLIMFAPLQFHLFTAILQNCGQIERPFDRGQHRGHHLRGRRRSSRADDPVP